MRMQWLDQQFSYITFSIILTNNKNQISDSLTKKERLITLIRIFINLLSIIIIY